MNKSFASLTPAMNGTQYTGTYAYPHPYARVAPGFYHREALPPATGFVALATGSKRFAYRAHSIVASAG
jgi:hypothetical protein